MMWSLILTLTVSAFAQTRSIRGYDEIRDDNGKIRPQYEQFYQTWSRLTENQKKWFLGRSRSAFQGDNALDPLPRVLTGAEYDQVLKPGVEQRAKALRAFLQDHYSGKKTYANAGVIPQDVVDRIIRRSYEAGFEGQVRPEQIAFFYGPDIIRDEKGVFRVIEDNPGAIGGVGDLRLAFQKIMQYYHLDPAKVPYRNPDDFYRDLAKSYQQQAARFGGIAVNYAEYPYIDKESMRLQKIFQDYGILTVSSAHKNQLLVKDDGVYLQNRDNPGVAVAKVGHVVMVSDHWWLDRSHPELQKRAAIWEIESHLGEDGLKPEVRKSMQAWLEKIQTDPSAFSMADVNSLLRKSDYINDLPRVLKGKAFAKNLVRSILAGKVGSNYSPGVDFIGDKEFYVFVEDLIRFYLKEEPLLRNITTERFADPKSGALNEVLFARIFSDLSKWVIKRVDGRGGDAVWVGPKVSSKEIPALEEKIRQEPGLYIVQAFTPLSRMNENIVDMRVISQVSAKNILVTETPWGRGLPMNGNGKVNLSDKGREVTILVRSERAPLCKWVFK